MKCKYRESYIHDGGLYFYCKGGKNDQYDCENSYDEGYICNWYREMPTLEDHWEDETEGVRYRMNCIHRRLLINNDGSVSWICSTLRLARSVCVNVEKEEFVCTWCLQAKAYIRYLPTSQCSSE